MPSKVRIDEASLWAKPSAIREWKALTEAIDKADTYPCYDKPDDYVDYPENISVDEAEQMCHNCPALKQCYDFAVANNITWGIWGGINFTQQEETNVRETKR